MTELDLLDRPAQVPAEKSRLFLATFLEDDARADAQHRAIGLRHGHALQGRSLGLNRFHVTLEFFGTYRRMPWGLVEQIVRALDGFEFDAFDVAFDAAASFHGKPSNHPLVMLGDVGVEALKAFQHGLGAALAEAGLCEAPHPGYTPHVTLLYDDRIVPPQRIAPVTWRVREFVLVQSVQGQTLHIPLARWRARGLDGGCRPRAWFETRSEEERSSPNPPFMQPNKSNLVRRPKAVSNHANGLSCVRPSTRPQRGRLRMTWSCATPPETSVRTPPRQLR